MAMQKAVLDGHDELYLLGCDLNYRDGVKKQDHFDPTYKVGDEQPAFYANRNALWGHICAVNTIQSLGVKVYNASNEGNLHLYPRKNPWQ